MSAPERVESSKGRSNVNSDLVGVGQEIRALSNPHLNTVLSLCERILSAETLDRDRPDREGVLMFWPLITKSKVEPSSIVVSARKSLFLVPIGIIL